MSVSRTGNKNHFFGKSHTEETRQKISMSNRGKNVWISSDKQSKLIKKEDLTLYNDEWYSGRKY